MKNLLKLLKEKECLLICSSSIKRRVLLSLDGLYNITFKTKEEAIDDILGSYSVNDMFYIARKLGKNYYKAQKVFSNIRLVDEAIDEKTKEILDFKKQLKRRFNPLAKKRYEGAIVILDEADELFDKALKEIENKTFYSLLGDGQSAIYEFKDIISEVEFVASKIALKIENGEKEINVFFNNPDYETVIKEIFPQYNLNYNYNFLSPAISVLEIKQYINKYRSYEMITDNLAELSKISSDIIIDCLNELLEFDYDDFIYLLKGKKISDKKVGLINVLKLKEFNYSKGSFILGFNDTIIPQVCLDNDYLSDSIKKKLGIIDSIKKNEINKEIVLNYIKLSSITATYPLSGLTMELEPANFIKGLEAEIDYTYSSSRALLMLAKKTDYFIKYGNQDELLSNLKTTFKDYKYNSYDNQFKRVNEKLIKEILKDNLCLSYTQINTFFECPFKYYANYILRIKAPSTNEIKVGNIFHKALEEGIKKELTNEDILNIIVANEYLINPLYLDIMVSFINRAIKNVKKQLAQSDFDICSLEKNFKINISSNTQLSGKIDKVLTCFINNKKYAIVIDYKTGEPDVDFNYVEHGLHMQLPIYFILLGKEYKFAGAFLEGVFPKRPLSYLPNNDYEKQLDKTYKLEGYFNDDFGVLNCMDKKMEETYINGLTLTSKGNIRSSNKALSQETFDKLKDYAYDKILEANKKIWDGDFLVSPFNKQVSCTFCHYRDVCFMKSKDSRDLDKGKKLAFLGGEFDDSEKNA